MLVAWQQWFLVGFLILFLLFFLIILVQPSVWVAVDDRMPGTGVAGR